MAPKKRRPHPARKGSESTAKLNKAQRFLMAARSSQNGTPPDQSYAEKVFVTPQLAEQWLTLNTENRPCPPQQSKKIAYEIEAGKWEINGETIKFDTRAVLRDGQTRLAGIVAAGIAVWCWTIFDIAPGHKPFESIDQGRLRSLGHLLAIRGYKNYNSLAHAARLIYQLHEDISGDPGGFVFRTGLSIVEEHPGLCDSLSWLITQGITETCSSGMAAALHYLMSLKDQDLARSFWDSIATGVITNKRSPVRAVRDVMVRNKLAKAEQKLTPTSLMALTIKGWNLMRRNRSCKVLRWGESEAFPSIA